MRNIKFFLIFFGIFCFSFGSHLHAKANAVIAIDASGSMRGFFRTQEIYKLVNKLEYSIKNTDLKIYCYKYSREGRNISGGEFAYALNENADGQITLLNRCFNSVRKNHPDAAIIYLVTDNVQDPEGAEEEQGDIEKFYDYLRSQEVKWVHIFPVQLEFFGPIYKRDGFSRLSDRYQGIRGLIVYSILLNLDQKEDYQEQISNFGNQVNFKGIEAKLLEGETVKVIPIQMEVLTPNGSQNKMLKLENNKLVSMRKQPFSEGEPIGGSFMLGFKSKLNSVSIDSPSVKVELIENFRLFGLGGESSDFTAGRPLVNWEPAVLSHSIIPGDVSIGELPKVKVDLLFEKGVRFRKNLGAILRYIQQSRAGAFKGALKVKLGVRSNNVRLIDEVSQKYSISRANYFESLNPEIQGKILDLDKLFKETYEYSDILAESYPVHFEVNYPIWPLFFYIAFAGIIIGAIVWTFNKRQQYTLKPLGAGQYLFERITFQKSDNTDLTDIYKSINGSEIQYDTFNEGATEKFRLLPLIGGHGIIYQGIKAGVIKFIPLYGILAIAKRNYTIDNKKSKKLDTIGSSSFYIQERSGLPDNDYSPAVDNPEEKDYSTASGSDGTDDNHSRPGSPKRDDFDDYNYPKLD